MLTLHFEFRCVPRAAGWVLALLTLVLIACEAPAGDVEPDEPDAVGQPEAVPAEHTATELSVRRAAAPESESGRLLTRLEPDSIGISHRNFLPFERSGAYLFLGAGVAAGDYDGDGLVDLYLVAQDGRSTLYRNRGGWRFEDVTQQAGVSIDRDVRTGRWAQRYPMGAYFFDPDDDGDLDLYVTVFAGSNAYFRNRGDGTFEEATEAAGLIYAGGSTTAAFSDYDRDGDVDIYVATYRPFALHRRFPPGIESAPSELAYDLEERDGEVALLPEADLLYRNNGDGTFTNVAEAAGVGEVRDWGLATKFADFDLDGWPDLYVANDFGSPDRFYLNNRDGTFRPMPQSAYRQTPVFSMGMDTGDLNNDGWPDLITTDMLSADRVRHLTQTMEPAPGEAPIQFPEDGVPQLMRNVLHLNNGDSTFVELAPLAGVAATNWTWSVKLTDVDLDGWQDILVTDGFVRDDMNADEIAITAQLRGSGNRDAYLDYMQSRAPLFTPNFAFRNTGGLRFEDVSDTWGFADSAIGHGMALADLDSDGDLDAVVNNMNTPVGIYRNDADASRLQIVLRGEASNHYGLDARVSVRVGEQTQTKVMSISGGYLSSHEPALVFGLGDATEADRVTIDWPSGHRAALEAVAADQRLVIEEPTGDAEIPPSPTAAPTQFEDVAAAVGAEYTHRETEHDDFERQPLLAYGLSRFGPGVAWGDPDGDGDPDLYVAGAASSGQLLENRGDGAFEPVSSPDLPADGLEEQAALWWPGDDGPSLITSLSSAEMDETGARPIVRQLPLDGLQLETADWTAEAEASGGALAAADYDGDGWLDLFVGGRFSPGRYPAPVPSRLFRGGPDGLMAADDDSPALSEIGLVSGAVWSDVDADGDPDLVLATDWGPLRLLVNEGGALVDGTANAGLADHSGWWNGIDAGDVDHDGDMDLVATNLGLNTLYDASAERPLVLFAGDLDEDGAMELVETEWDGDQLYSRRNLVEIARHLPFVLDRYETFRSFAFAPIDEVLGDARDDARRLEATTLANTLLLNDGRGRFEARALPDEAQLFPGYGVAVADLDSDGHDDIYLVGNQSSAHPVSHGAFMGGVSAWLRGDGTGSFTPVPVRQSGLSVPADGRGLATADYDGDGWLDLAVGVNDGALRLFRNHGVDGRSGLLVRLVGSKGNPEAVGARVTVTRSDDLVITREVRAGGSFLSAHSPTLHFGLDEVDGPVSVDVRWPDGTMTTHTHDPADGRLEVSPRP